MAFGDTQNCSFEPQDTLTIQQPVTTPNKIDKFLEKIPAGAPGFCEHSEPRNAGSRLVPASREREAGREREDQLCAGSRVPEGEPAFLPGLHHY